MQFKIFSLFYDVSSICLPLSMNLDRLELSMSCHDRDMWRAYPRIVYHITSNLYCQYISMYLYFPFDLIRQPRGRGVLIAAGVNIRQPLTQQGPRPVLIMFPFYNLFLCIALKIAAGAFLFCLISNVLVIAYLTRPSSSGGSTGYIFFLFYQIFKTNKL